MPPPIDKRTIKAAALLKMPHPKHPERTYTMAEAAEKMGINRSTVFRHIKREQEKKA